MAAIAASTALHYGVFIAQPLFLRFGPPQRQTPSSGSVQRIVVRVIEQTPASVAPLPMPAAMTTPETLQLASSKAGSAQSAVPPMMPVSAWRPAVDIRFYATAEVDQPALPVLNWQFPSQTPASIQLRHMIVQIWIAENGDILNVAILSSQPEIPREQKQNIEQGLMQTQMTPAMKDGRQVASQRTLEMAVEF